MERGSRNFLFSQWCSRKASDFEDSQEMDSRRSRARRDVDFKESIRGLERSPFQAFRWHQQNLKKALARFFRQAVGFMYTLLALTTALFRPFLVATRRKIECVGCTDLADKTWTA